MSKRTVGYFVRHGTHQNNILTDEGRVQVDAAAAAIKADMRGVDLEQRQLLLFSSVEPRAVESSARGAVILEVKVLGGVQPDINPATGLGAAIQAGKLPAPGQGCIRAWMTSCPDGVENWGAVRLRVQGWLLEGGIALDSFLPVAWCHGGAIEPAITGFEGADDHDLACGEVAVVEIGLLADGKAGYSVRFLNQKTKGGE